MGAAELSEAPPAEVIWSPTPKQAEFLAAAEEEVLFGGAAGGGKTDSLVIDCLGLAFDALEQRRYRAIVFRREFPMLRDVIDRSLALYPLIKPGATYNSNDHVWTFPSGAKVYFGHLQHDKDRYDHQGQEYQYVGFEELTQWATDVCWEYLKSRNRGGRAMGIPDLMRATCNPGGLGSKWVQNYFDIPDDGTPSYKLMVVDVDGEPVTVRRRFIPSRLGDNPYLGKEYKVKLLMMPENERKALLSGRWDVVDIPGQVWKLELEQLVASGRLTRVPWEPALPVHTAWDLGMADSTVIWFAQVLPGSREVRLIDYYEANGEGLQHYAQVLQRKPYVYGTHLGPHDIEVRELGTGKSRKEIAAQLGIDFEVVPNMGLEDGIEAVRQMLPRVYIDREQCARGWDCIKHYRREYNEKMGAFKPVPVHDWASHGADGLRTLAVMVDRLRNGRTAAKKKAPVTSWRAA
jgi:hypothetical protein